MQPRFMCIIMNKFRLSLFIVILFCLNSVVSPAQVNDAGMWYSLNLEKKLTKNITAEAGGELRLNENFSELGTFFTEAGIEYRLSRQVAFSLGYRFTQKRRVDDSYSSRHRLLVNLNLKQKWGMMNFGARFRYQSQYADINSSEDGKIPLNYLRVKVNGKADLEKRYAPYISYEAFIQLNRPEGMLYDNYRVAAGIEYEFNKKSSVNLGYMIDREINVNDPWTNYVVTLGWTFKL